MTCELRNCVRGPAAPESKPVGFRPLVRGISTSFDFALTLRLQRRRTAVALS